MSIFQPETMWASESVLYYYASKFSARYWYRAKFFEQHKIKAYIDQSKDWGIWLEIVGELLGQMIEPFDYLEQCWVNDRIPKPSDLLKQSYIDRYNVWRNKQLQIGTSAKLVWSYGHSIKNIHLETISAIRDWNRFHDEPMSECPVEELAHAFCRRHNWIGYEDQVVEEYVYASHRGFVHMICDEDMFMRVVMKYYPYKEVYNSLQGPKKFFCLFEPVAREAYLKFTDFAKIDLDQFKAELTREYPRAF